MSAAVDRVGSLPHVPAAGWDEREAADLFGIGFAGHAPLRPLVNHEPRLDRWTVPVHGSDPYQVAVGPIHAGVIESGHFRFHVVGDRILHLDGRLFYKHRGLEEAARGKTLDEGLAYVARACAACTVANGVAYAQACEEILGLMPAPSVQRVRTLLLELERTWNHLNDIAAVCAGVGLAAGNNRFAGLTERARRLNAALTGHRFLFGSVRVGGSRLEIDTDQIRAARAELSALRTEASGAWRELVFNSSFQDRLPDIGIVDAQAATQLGVVGPAARAAGLAEDARATSLHLTYEGFAPTVPHRAVGDVQARLEQRALELEQTFELLDELLAGEIFPRRRRRRRRRARDRSRPRREPTRSDHLRRRARRRTHREAPAPHRLLRQLAGRRLRRRRQPAPRLPAHQQELRALLRLQRPLMLTLLRDLRRLRRDIALPRPDRGRSLAIRHVDAGSCNGCEHELTLTSSPYTDLQRFGLGIVASPRHADVLLVTGPVTSRMREPLLIAYHAMPEPRRVAALGDCALGCNLLGTAANVLGGVETVLSVDLRIPGCPPTPETIARALLTLIDQPDDRHMVESQQS